MAYSRPFQPTILGHTLEEHCLANMTPTSALLNVSLLPQTIVTLRPPLEQPATLDSSNYGLLKILLAIRPQLFTFLMVRG